jgi:hypothetical protein
MSPQARDATIKHFSQFFPGLLVQVLKGRQWKMWRSLSSLLVSRPEAWR